MYMFVIIAAYATMFVIIAAYAAMFVIIAAYAAMFVIIAAYATMFNITAAHATRFVIINSFILLFGSLIIKFHLCQFHLSLFFCFVDFSILVVYVFLYVFWLSLILLNTHYIY